MNESFSQLTPNQQAMLRQIVRDRIVAKHKKPAYVPTSEAMRQRLQYVEGYTVAPYYRRRPSR